MLHTRPYAPDPCASGEALMKMNKINGLFDRLERVRLARDQDGDPDALSMSLWAFGAELAALDEKGLADKAVEWGISPDDVRDMARTYAR